MKIRARVLTKLPATLQASGGLKVLKENGRWTFSPDWTQLALEETLPDPANRHLWAMNPNTGVYTRINAATLINTVSGSFVNFNEPQSLTDEQKEQARENVGAARSADYLNVKDFGAKGDGSTDDTDAVKSYASYLAEVGGVMRFPAGRYLITDTIALDYAAAALATRRGIQVEGDGSGCTTIISNHAGAAFSLFRTAGLAQAYGQFRGLQIYQTGASGRTGTGILIDNIAFLNFHDLVIYNTKYAVRATDFLTSGFTDCVFRANDYGVYLEGSAGLSPPNNITFSRSTILANREWGVTVVGGRQPRFVDCSFEETGNAGSETDRYSLKLVNPAGPVAVSMRGCYITHNRGLSDIWVVMGSDPCAIDISDCQFTRISNTNYVDNHIRVDQASGAGDFKLCLTGNAFRRLNTYVADAGRPYISLTDGSGGAAAGSYEVFIPEGANYFGDAVEAPAYTTNYGQGRFLNEGLRLRDTDGSHDLIVKPGSNLTQDRTLTIFTQDASRTLNISANATISQDYGSTGSPIFAYNRLTQALRINDTDDSHYLEIAPGSDQTANRSLSLQTGDQDRIVTTAGFDLLAAVSARGQAAVVRAPYVLASSAVAASHTGDTNETALATIALPAGAMGPNGALRITTLWSYSNSANNKTMRTRLGGILGTSHGTTVATTTASLRTQVEIHNRNAQNSQVSVVAGFGSGTMFGVTGSAPTTGSIDTASAQDIVLSAQLANTGDTITLEYYLVELIYGS